MEIPARARRRVVVLGLSQDKLRVLVIKGQNDLWHIPDSHLHWDIGRRKQNPQSIASNLIKDALLSLIGDFTLIQDYITKNGTRFMLPTGGFIYLVPSNHDFDISRATLDISRVRKHLKIGGKCEMHLIEDILLPTSHSKYGPGTIETVRSGCLNFSSNANFTPHIE